jgi:deoxycytidylate deaminase
MEKAIKYSTLSPDPFRKVGAVALAEDMTCISSGLNHAGVAGSNPWIWEDRDARRPLMIHAEQDLVKNLIITRKKPFICVINLLPCTSCMTLLAVFKFQKVVYLNAYKRDLESIRVGRMHGIEVEPLDPVSCQTIDT